MTDFGAENAFAGAAAKLKEHYGIEVPVSAVRVVTEEHGAAMLAQEKQKSDWPESGGVAGAPVLIAEIDRKSTRLNSSHTVISYAVFCLKKKSHTADSAFADALSQPRN